MSNRSLAAFRVAPVLVAALAVPFGAGSARAQACTADVQCRDGGRSHTYCAGNTLVVARSVCAGSCRTVEERREVCPGSCIAGSCLASPTPRPEAKGRAGKDPAWPLCAPACTCRNKVLVITTGQWTADSGCVQQIRRCARGCHCDPAPRCR